VKIHLISGLEDRLPFTIEDANRPEAEIESSEQQLNRVLLDTRLNHRVVDLRTPTNHAVFRLQAAIGDLFREYLNSQGFIEIHSPKLQGSATESGASVFKVSYFKGLSFTLTSYDSLTLDINRRRVSGTITAVGETNGYCCRF
jgi:aspartyl-tRNA synthetase